MAIEAMEAVDVQRWLAERAIILIDVREPHEFAAERIHGAFLYPLSTFDARTLPFPQKQRVVLYCGTGLRSAKALTACEIAGVNVSAHIKGGLAAWKKAGLPTMNTDPETGAVRDVA
jgi:rhodanese-related sulfurtransferase